MCVDLVKNREGGLPVLVGGGHLRLPQRPRHVPLPERPTSAGGEDKRPRPGVARAKLVTGEQERELPRDRHGASRAIGLCRPTVALPVDLPAEGQLGFIQVGKIDVRPFGLSEAAIRVVGLEPFQPSRRAANL